LLGVVAHQAVGSLIILTVEITIGMIYKRYVYANYGCRNSIKEFLKMYL